MVVDNGSTDGTVDAVSELACGDPRIRVVEEPTLGLSQARNTGTRLARGDIVAFIDDDAVVVAGWSEAVLEMFERSPGVAAVGGRSILDWPGGRRPDWLPTRYDALYSAVDYGDQPARLESPRNPYGVNMAFRRSWLERLGGFDVRLGRKGKSLVSCEEQDLFLRLRSAGGEVWYTPAAVVHHRVEPERVSRSWVARRTFAQGLSHGLAPHLRFPTTVEARDPSGTSERPALLQRLAVRALYESGKLAGTLQRVRG